MPYSEKNINGDAGEYFLAYKITSLLGIPCRLYGVDLGIDAECELLKEDGTETGDIVKIQVKSRKKVKWTKEKKYRVSVSSKHVKYWKNFCTPIIVCLVDLCRQEIYWKAIYDTRSYAGSGESMGVTFCKTHDLLTEQTKNSFSRMFGNNSGKGIGELMEKIERKAMDLPFNDCAIISFETVDKVREECRELLAEIRQAQSMVDANPWRIFPSDLIYLIKVEAQVNRSLGFCSKAEAELVNGG